MKVMAQNYGMTPPQWRMLVGAPDVVEPVLDRLGLERRRNDETGVIDHANLFLLVDPNGRIAYRLTLGDRQEHWLTTALEHLAREAQGPRG
jgi:cytochrome oxidase Cu insertion factor (SCO1/SenC/PrrC family)